MASSKRPTPRRLLVYAAGLAALWFARPSFPTLVIGFCAALAGIAIRVWATGYLAKNERLTVEGPYRHVRHPLYLGTWLIATGVLIACLGPDAPLGILLPIFAGFQVAFFAYYLPKKERREGERLRRRFGEAFERFRARVPLFVPRLSPAPSDESEPLSWSAARVGENSEWGVVAGTLLVFGFLLGKAAGWLP